MYVCVDWSGRKRRHIHKLSRYTYIYIYIFTGEITLHVKVKKGKKTFQEFQCLNFILFWLMRNLGFVKDIPILVCNPLVRSV